MRKITSKIWIFVPFITLLVYLVIQNSFVNLTFDDFGYISLTYGYAENINGMNFTLNDIFSFLKWHYNNWGGRVVYFFLEIVILSKSLILMQIVQSLIMFGIIVFAYLIFKNKEKNNLILAILFCLSYGLVSRESAKDAMYWFTASVLYLWPFFFFFLGILLFNLYEKKRNICLLVFSIISFTLGASSQEQIAVGIIVYTLVFFLLKSITNKKFSLSSFLVFLFATVGALFILLAPGNLVRSNNADNAWFSELSLFGKLIHNVPFIINNNFSTRVIFFTILSILFTLLIPFINNKEIRTKRFIVEISSVSIISIFLLLEMFLKKINFLYVICFICLILYWAISLSVFFFRRKDYVSISLILFSYFTQFCLVVSPTISLRCQFPFEFSMTFIFLLAIYQFVGDKNKYLQGSFIIPFVLVSSINGLYLAINYGINNVVEKDNAYILNHYENYLDKTNNTITLTKLPDDSFVSCLPYQDNFDYIEYWMRNYYSIPQDVDFIWVKK